MRKRLIVLGAVVALLLVGAVPVSAAPGGVPGPPPGHGKSDDAVATDEVDTSESDGEEAGPPEHANAYGKRIKDEYGVPFGHLQQCAGVTDVTIDDEAITGGEDAEGDGGVKKALEACPEDLEFPEGETGAKAFWVFAKLGTEIFPT